MNAGFVPGAANPCVFHHEGKGISIVVHGDDFTALGDDDALDWYEQILRDSFEIKVRGRLGVGCTGPQQLRILNRVITLTEQGITFEADPKHHDLLLSSLELTSASASATPGVKPQDRDEFATKENENDYTDPDAVIAAICRSDAEKCENQGLNGGISKCSTTHSHPDHDDWLIRGENGVWARRYVTDRWNLDTPTHYVDGPPDFGILAPMRFTIGSFSKTGEAFSLYDSWRNPSDAHASLRNKWQGITMWFTRDCDDIDECISNLCSVTESGDVHMSQAKQLRFDESRNSVIEVQPYSECYELHPHFLLPTKNGWKRTPARADPFTGKSSMVMKERRKSAKRLLKTKNAHATRLRIMNEANKEFKPQPIEVDTDLPMPMDMSALTDPIMATRTKPKVPAKYKQRMGAKKAKKLELSSDSGHTLSPANATLYRALSARCNYLSQDRPDLAFSSKELCREFSVPTMTSLKKLKRLVRYLAGMPRLVYKYKFQDAPACIDLYVDTDFAGCKETRRSTSGGVAMIGGCCVKHYAKTQTTIALSSGEAELHGIAQGCAQALGIQSLCRDMGWSLKIVVHSDATAAIGIARRKGLGRIRHLDVTDLWIQDKIRSRQMELRKVEGTKNCADVLTKYVDRPSMEAALKTMSMERMDGRPECAPQTMGI